MPIETISIPNFADTNVIGETELTADAAAAATSLGLLNASEFLQNDYLVLSPGKAMGELTQISAPIVSESVTISPALSLQHRNHERLVRLFGNQIKVYKAADTNGLPPASSAFTTLVGTVTIDPTNGDSTVSDAAGGTGYWYIFTYYNQHATSETDKALAEPIRGGGYGVMCSLEEIKDEAGTDDVDRLPDWKVAIRRSEAQDEINGKLSSAGYTIPLQTSTGVAFIPDIIKGIAIRLAAGFILKKNFGVTRPGSSKNGDDKIKEARQDLAEIQLNDTVLLDSTGQVLAKTNLVDGWPDDTTQVTLPTGRVVTGSIFTMDKEF